MTKNTGHSLSEWGPSENIIDHLSRVLDLILPVGENRFLYVSPRERSHREDLGNVIGEWLMSAMLLESRLEPYHQKDFQDGPFLVRVRVQHLLHDHWLVKTYRAGVNEWGGIEVLDGPAACALLRVDGSGSKVYCEEVV